MKISTAFLVVLFSALSFWPSFSLGREIVRRTGLPHTSISDMTVPRAICLKSALYYSVPENTEKSYCADLKDEAQAICVGAALSMDFLGYKLAKEFCSDVDSRPMAICLEGALEMQEVNDRIPGDNPEKKFCKGMKTDTQAVCVRGAVRSERIKAGQELAYCAGVHSIGVALCLEAALLSSAIAANKDSSKEKAYCASVKDQENGICLAATLAANEPSKQLEEKGILRRNSKQTSRTLCFSSVESCSSHQPRSKSLLFRYCF